MGLDLGAHSLKATVIRREGRANILVKALSFPIAGGIDWANTPASSPVLRELRAALAANGLRNTDTCFALPPNGIVQRWVDLEGLPPTERADAARHRLRKFIPDQKQVYVAVSEDTDPITNEHLVTVLPRAKVDQYAEAVLALGLNPLTAEPESNALLRVAGSVLRRRSPLLRDGAAILIDIGMNRTRVDIVRDERVEFTREFRFGASGFLERIVQELVLSPAEAETALQSMGTKLSPRGWLQVPTPGGLAQIDVNEPISVLLQESSRLIRYFRSIYPERSYSGTVSTALITGGMAALDGMVDFIERALSIETSTIDPLSVVRVDLPEDEFVMLARSPFSFSTATGLALTIRNLNQNQEEGSRDRTGNWAHAA